MDRMRPSRLGDFPDRLALVLRALYDIDNENLDISVRILAVTSPTRLVAKLMKARLFFWTANRVPRFNSGRGLHKINDLRTRPAAPSFSSVKRQAPGPKHVGAAQGTGTASGAGAPIAVILS